MQVRLLLLCNCSLLPVVCRCEGGICGQRKLVRSLAMLLVIAGDVLGDFIGEVVNLATHHVMVAWWAMMMNQEKNVNFPKNIPKKREKLNVNGY